MKASSILGFLLFVVCTTSSAEPKFSEGSNTRKILKGLNLAEERFTPIDIFGPSVDRVEEIDGVFYLTSTSSKKDERWEIVMGTPEIDSLLRAKNPTEFIAALQKTGNPNNLAISWKEPETLLQNMQLEPNTAFDVHVRRLYIDGEHLYTLAFKAVLRHKPMSPQSPDLVTIPTLVLQRFDSTVIKRLLE